MPWARGLANSLEVDYIDDDDGSKVALNYWPQGGSDPQIMASGASKRNFDI